MALLRNERDGGERDRAFVRARQIQLNSFPIDKNWNGTLVLVPPLVGEVDEGETCSRPFLFVHHFVFVSDALPFCCEHVA
jgi:hypothetical protein